MNSQYLSGERVFLFLVCSHKKDTKFCFSIGPFIFANCIYDVKVLESLAWCCVFCEGKNLWIWAYTDMSWKKRWFCSGAVAFFTVSGLEPMLGLFYAKYDFSATKTLNRKVAFPLVLLAFYCWKVSPPGPPPVRSLNSSWYKICRIDSGRHLFTGKTDGNKLNFYWIEDCIAACGKIAFDTKVVKKKTNSRWNITLILR